MNQQHEVRVGIISWMMFLITEAFLLVGGIDEGLQDVVHFLSGLSALLNHFEEDVLDLSVSSVPFPNKTGYICVAVFITVPLLEQHIVGPEVPQQSYLKLGSGSQPGRSQAA